MKGGSELTLSLRDMTFYEQGTPIPAGRFCSLILLLLPQEMPFSAMGAASQSPPIARFQEVFGVATGQGLQLKLRTFAFLKSTTFKEKPMLFNIKRPQVKVTLQTSPQVKDLPFGFVYKRSYPSDAC
uniref:Uncharacterized protein n=1 Tax=Sphaerodactylus townsendi TaxID=933632 RepID=A0ACB8F3K4_9SAUR